jgi:murein DD-endopeptidase MepM/ murein hydrolase activator NlpD
MKKIACSLILSISLAASGTTILGDEGEYGPFFVLPYYGHPVPYGEGKHPGVDINLPIGTPIIAVSDGIVSLVYPGTSGKSYMGGCSVSIEHGEHFESGYGHLSKVFVVVAQPVKRGQLIGLSGASGGSDEHLHFAIRRILGNPFMYSDSYDPANFFLGGKAQCFDPNKDYSSYSQKEITLPVACGEYTKILISEANKMETTAICINP